MIGARSNIWYPMTGREAWKYARVKAIDDQASIINLTSEHVTGMESLSGIRPCEIEFDKCHSVMN